MDDDDGAEDDAGPSGRASQQATHAADWHVLLHSPAPPTLCLIPPHPSPLSLPPPRPPQVLLINADGSALQFNNPKVQASIAANTYVVSGASQPKRECRHCLGQQRHCLAQRQARACAFWLPPAVSRPSTRDCIAGPTPLGGTLAVTHQRLRLLLLICRRPGRDGLHAGRHGRHGGPAAGGHRAHDTRAVCHEGTWRAIAELLPAACHVLPGRGWLGTGRLPAARNLRRHHPAAACVRSADLHAARVCLCAPQMMGGMGGMPAFNPEGAADEPEEEDDGGLEG